MNISCPFCHSVARLRPNPEADGGGIIPLYLLECSGCSATNVRPAAWRRQRRCSVDDTFVPESFVDAG